MICEGFIFLINSIRQVEKLSACCAGCSREQMTCFGGRDNPAVYFPPNRSLSSDSCADSESRKLWQQLDSRVVDGNVHVAFTWKKPRAALTRNDWWISWTQLKEQQPPGGFHCEEFLTSLTDWICRDLVFFSLKIISRGASPSCLQEWKP